MCLGGVGRPSVHLENKTKTYEIKVILSAREVYNYRTTESLRRGLCHQGWGDRQDQANSE